MFMSFDVDADGNLYVPDTYNNRILVYHAPFSEDKSDGKGDNIPDFVIGQADFTSNGINRGKGPGVRDAGSLFISFGGFDHVASRGVSVDPKGDVWVADTFNFRVLRFPKGSKTANLVLGQADFTESQPACQLPGEIKDKPLDRMCTPTVARINPDTDELFVVDEYPGGFPARILVFQPPFHNGMVASRVVFPQQPLEGDFAKGYRLAHATGLVFNPVKTDDWTDPDTKTSRYRDGVFWLHDSGDGSSRTLLLDAEGKILVTVGAPDLLTYGCTLGAVRTGWANRQNPFNLVWPGGMMGFDAQNNIYLADGHFSRIARYALPYRIRKTDKGACLPDFNGGMLPNVPPLVGPGTFAADRVGVAVIDHQLLVRDEQRYMVWNNYLTKDCGAPADFVVGQETAGDLRQRNHIMGRSMHAIDYRKRLWSICEHGLLMVYQLPLKTGATPLGDVLPLYWADDPESRVEFRGGTAIAFDPGSRKLWVSDPSHHRLLRIRNPDGWADKLLVDAVLGQKNKTDGALNRGMTKPDAASIGEVNDIRFDRLGNMFVVDNTYEGHPNGRVIAFLAKDLAKIDAMFPAIEAKKLYVTERFDQTEICRSNLPVDCPFSPVSIAFNSRNEMVIGNDGYYRDGKIRHLRQLYLYRKPLEKATPDAVIELPLGAPGEIVFDDRDNLIIQDHTWCRLWIINYDKDSAWLHPL